MSSLTLPDLLFLAIAAFTVVSAAGVAFSRNIVYSAFSLMGTFMAAAAIYVFLAADFVAVVQVLIYVGGVLILILFAIFLSQRISDVKLSNPARFHWQAAFLCLCLFGVLSYTAVSTAFPFKPVTVYQPSTAEIGELLMTRYLLPFEVASVLLLAALIGAALLSRPEARKGASSDMEEPK